MKRLHSFNTSKQPILLPSLFPLYDKFDLQNVKVFLEQVTAAYQNYIKQHDLLLLSNAEDEDLSTEQQNIICFRLLIAESNILIRDSENQTINKESQESYITLILNLYAHLATKLSIDENMLPIASSLPKAPTPLQEKLPQERSKEPSALSLFYNLPDPIYKDEIFPHLSSSDIQNLHLALTFKDKKDSPSIEQQAVIDKFTENENNRIQHNKLFKEHQVQEPEHYQYSTLNSMLLIHHPFFKKTSVQLKENRKKFIEDVKSSLLDADITGCDETSKSKMERVILLFAKSFFEDQKNEESIKIIIKNIHELALGETFKAKQLYVMMIYYSLIFHANLYKSASLIHLQNAFLDAFFSNLEFSINFKKLVGNYNYEKINFLNVIKLYMLIGIACNQAERLQYFYDEIILRMILTETQTDEFSEEDGIDIYNVGSLVRAYVDQAYHLDFDPITDESRKDSVLMKAFQARNIQLFTVTLANNHCKAFSTDKLEQFILNAKTGQDRDFVEQIIQLLIYMKNNIKDFIDEVFINSNVYYRNDNEYFRTLIPFLKQNRFFDLATQLENDIKETTNEYDFESFQRMTALLERAFSADEIQSLIFEKLQSNELISDDTMASWIEMFFKISDYKSETMLISFIDHMLSELRMDEDGMRNEISHLNGIKNALSAHQKENSEYETLLRKRKITNFESEEPPTKQLSSRG